MIVIKWNKLALQQFESAIEYIELDSPSNAERVKRSILSMIDELQHHPEMHAPDKYKLNNDGSFKAFEIYHYRISYRYKNGEVRIIRVRHTAMNPRQY